MTLIYIFPNLLNINKCLLYQNRSDNGKASVTAQNVNDHLDALNIDVVDNRNIGGNCLNNISLHLNSTRYGKLAINFIKKMRNLSKNWWSQDSFCYNPNTYEKVSYKITEFDKEKLGVNSIIVASTLRVKNQAMI